MKTYKYTINGTKYEVAIGDIADNIATVTVNGEEFKVEMEPEAEPEKKKVVVKTGVATEATQAAPAEGGAPVNTNNARGHEDGQQPGGRESRQGDRHPGDPRSQCHGRHPTHRY